jgi:hypothetical protein
MPPPGCWHRWQIRGTRGTIAAVLDAVLKTNAGPCHYLTESIGKADVCHRCTGCAAPGDLSRSVSDQPAVADHVVAAGVRAAAGLPQITPSDYVQDRHQRDETQDRPHQFSASPQIRPVGGQVDPHEDYSHGMQETNQDLKELLHKLNLPRSAGAVPAPVIHVVPCRPPPVRPGLMLYPLWESVPGIGCGVGCCGMSGGQDPVSGRRAGCR